LLSALYQGGARQGQILWRVSTADAHVCFRQFPDGLLFVLVTSEQAPGPSALSSIVLKKFEAIHTTLRLLLGINALKQNSRGTRLQKQLQVLLP
jgi:hypothetical protein